jgi:hypothetical protein
MSTWISTGTALTEPGERVGGGVYASPLSRRARWSGCVRSQLAPGAQLPGLRVAQMGPNCAASIKGWECPTLHRWGRWVAGPWKQSALKVIPRPARFPGSLQLNARRLFPRVRIWPCPRHAFRPDPTVPPLLFRRLSVGSRLWVLADGATDCSLSLSITRFGDPRPLVVACHGAGSQAPHSVQAFLQAAEKTGSICWRATLGTALGTPSEGRSALM